LRTGLLRDQEQAEHDREVDDRRAGTNGDHTCQRALDRRQQVQQAEDAGNGQRHGEKLGRAEFVEALRARPIQDQVAAGDEEAEQERQPGEGAAGDQGYDARGRVALAEVGEHIQRGDDANEDDRPEIDGGVAADETEDQVFAGVADRPSLP